MTGREISLLHVHGGAIGYGRLGVELAKALNAQGVDVYDVLEAPIPSKKHAHKILEDGGNYKRTNVVAWVSVPTHARGWWKGQKPAIFTMWEATQLPESFRETLHEFHTVVVPSEHNVELFSRYHDNVHYVPLGVDPTEWHYVPRPRAGQFFDFLIGGSGKRKGVHLAFDAFQRVFGKIEESADRPIPRIVFKSPKGMCACDDCRVNGRNWAGDRVQVVSGRLTAQEEIDLYASAHCYLQPSYGEGFGLQPLQAMAQGCPTILTSAHGHKAFAHLGIELGARMEKADYFIYGDAGEWWAPDFDQLCESMEWVYENYTQACYHAKQGAASIADEFTWDLTARRFCDVFGDELSTPGPETDEWVAPQTRRFLVMVRQPKIIDVAGTKHFFEPGQKYYELADVKRILFEAGWLDPECLTGWGLEAGGATDLGLTESQLARIPEYTAAHSNCPTCGQRLNTSPTRSDELFAEMTCAS